MRKRFTGLHRRCENEKIFYINDCHLERSERKDFSAESILSISKDLEMTKYKTRNDLNVLNQLKITE